MAYHYKRLVYSKKQVTIAGLMAVDMRIMILWDVKSCNILAAYKHFR